MDVVEVQGVKHNNVRVNKGDGLRRGGQGGVGQSEVVEGMIEQCGMGQGVVVPIRRGKVRVGKVGLRHAHVQPTLVISRARGPNAE